MKNFRSLSWLDREPLYVKSVILYYRCLFWLRTRCPTMDVFTSYLLVGLFGFTVIINIPISFEIDDLLRLFFAVGFSYCGMYAVLYGRGLKKLKRAIKKYQNGHYQNRLGKFEQDLDKASEIMNKGFQCFFAGLVCVSIGCVFEVHDNYLKIAHANCSNAKCNWEYINFYIHIFLFAFVAIALVTLLRLVAKKAVDKT